MIKLFGEKKDPEQAAREAIQQHKWAKAIAYYEQKAQRGERDFALWNLLGDLHLNNKSRQRAMDDWHRALDGYAQEGLYENVLGIARKILRRLPDEDEVFLVLARASIELEYHADCLAAIRSYIRAARRPAEHDLKGLFSRIMESKIHHPHLLEELRTLYADSKVEDVELAAKLAKFIESRLQSEGERVSVEMQTTSVEAPAAEMRRISTSAPAPAEGLIMLDQRSDSEPAAQTPAVIHTSAPSLNGSETTDYHSDFNPEMEETDLNPSSDGKDHYDLGNVYREMQLWDAAATEFEQARLDPALRLRASLALAECLQETNSLPAALEILETEGRSGIGTPQERINLHFQLGVTYEMLGNFNEAIGQFEAVLNQNPRHAAAAEKLQSLQKRKTAEPK